VETKLRPPQTLSRLSPLPLRNLRRRLKLQLHQRVPRRQVLRQQLRSLPDKLIAR